MLTIQGLQAWYDKNIPILSDISFTLSDNSVVGLLGLNGAGKTTLLNTISGVHSGYKYSKLNYNGEDFNFEDIKWKKKRYTVFTEEQAFSYWSFNEYLHFIEKVYDKKINNNHLEELIKGFTFEKYINYPMKDLSTGNKKKVFLITGFSLELPFLILDEPLDGLDFLSSNFLYEEILQYKKFGTILMSSHIAESIEKTCHKVIILKEGHCKLHNLSKTENLTDSLEVWLHDK
ncbi:ABC transporter ATP-binding protein [Clostridium sp. Marseille-Q2269]|uniref:ATP-binding cassette domain-containing protein n=1 Tax=Clostridium sp. Marseille-Q2269 TaxID=2942205 RepID=UPI002073C921|nr:ABC transporter ATP-binding protein [Clostridium sp. Marseille-Q2269]